MAVPPSDKGSSRERLFDRIVSDYMDAVQEGDPPPREELIRLHPDLASELQAFFASLDEFGAAAEPLHERFFPPDGDERLAEAVPGYTILQEIGRGGQGVVYEALQDSTGRRVALKILLASPFADDESRYRFEREVKLTARLDHPAIVGIYDGGVAVSHCYYTMELVRGEPLNQYVRARDLSIRETIALFQIACDAVGHAHELGIIHRDLKPSNILVGRDGTPRILDFGLAKALDVESSEASTLAVSVTGQVLGTLEYMSPEQAAGQPAEVDLRSDVYSLGVILFELLTGVLPYDLRGSVSHDLAQIQRTDPRRPRRLRRGLGNELETIVLRALQKEKSRRYANGRALADDLRRFLAGEPIEAKRDHPLYVIQKTLRRHRSALAIGTTMLALLVAAAIAGWALYLRTEQDRREEIRRASEAETRARESQRDLLLSQAQMKARESRSGRRELARESLRRSARLGVSPEHFREAVAISALWDARPVALEHAAAPAPGEYQPLAVSPDGRHLVSLSMSGFVLWELPTGRMLTPSERWHSGSGGRVPLRFSPDGQWLAVGTPMAVEIHHFGGDLELPPAGTIPDSVGALSLTWSPDSRHLSVGQPSRTSIWDLRGDTPRLAWQAEGARPLAFAPDGARFAFGLGDGRCAIRDLDGKQAETIRAPGLEGTISALAWVSRLGGEFTVVGTDLGEAALWREGEEHPESRWLAHDTTVSQFAAVDGMPWFISLGYRGEIQLWDLHSSALVLSMELHAPSYSGGVTVSADGRFVASEGTLTSAAYEILTPRAQWRRSGSPLAIWSVAFAPGSTRVATLGGDWKIRLWRTRTGDLEQTLVPRRGRYLDNTDLAFTPGGDRLAFADSNGNVELWDLAGGCSLGKWSLDTPRRALLPRLYFHADGGLGLVRHEQDERSGAPWWIRIYRLHPIHPARRFELTREVRSPGQNLFSSAPIVEGKHYLWLGPRLPAAERRLRMVDLDTGEEVDRQEVAGVLAIEPAAAASLQLSPDAELVLAGPATWSRAWSLFRVANSQLVPLPRGPVWSELGARGAIGPGARWFLRQERATTSLSLWDTDAGDVALGLPLPAANILSASFSPDGEWLLVGDRAGSLHGYELAEIVSLLEELGR